MKKLLAIGSAALIASVTLASPASTMPTGPGVGPDKNISVFHNLDFVAAFGYAYNNQTEVGEPLTVEVFRDGARIGHAAGPAVSADEGLPDDGALEVNHGPEGDPVPGDCWTDYTPDIIPGDRVVVTSAGGTVTDEVLVDNITFSGPPKEDLSTEDPSDIIVEGRAAYADGTSIPIEQLDSGELRLGSTFRATPNTLVRTPGTTDGWTATYKAPYEAFKGQNLPFEQQKQAILNGDHAMGYGHVAPLPPETQLAEGLGSGGPALGCEQAAKQSNAVVSTGDDAAVNIGSGDLVVSGTAMADVTAVTGTVKDTAGNSVPFDATDSLSAGPGEKTWQVTIPRTDPNAPDLDELLDGTLTIEGAYTGSYTLSNGTVGDATIGGAKKQIEKDVVAPVISDNTDPAGPGPFIDSVAVGLSSDGNEAVRYTTDGSVPNDNSKLYDGTRFQLGLGTHTVNAAAKDAAGNQANASFSYTVNAKETTSTSLNLSKPQVKRGKVVAISGAVAPAQEPDAKVTLTIKRGTATVATQVVDLNDTSGAYSSTFRAPKKTGTYTVSAKFAGDANSLESTSPTKRFKVVL